MMTRFIEANAQKGSTILRVSFQKNEFNTWETCRQVLHWWGGNWTPWIEEAGPYTHETLSAAIKNLEDKGWVLS